MSEQQKQAVIQYFEQLISESTPTYNFPVNNLFNPCKIHFGDVSNHEMYQNILFDNEIRQTMARHLADYKLLIHKVQRHTFHGPGCLRKVSGTNRTVCRFGFDKELISESRIIRKDNNTLDLQMKRNDGKVNNHCPIMTVHWRGNTDFKPIISLQTVVNYLAKYASKSEQASGNITQIREMINSLQTSNRTSISFIQSVLIKQASLRDYSAQEAIWILMSYNFYSSSRQFVQLNLKDDAFVFIDESRDNDPQNVYANRLSYNLPRSEIQNAGENDQESILRNLSMYNFFSRYYLRTRNSTTLSKRRKKAVLRIFPRPLATNARNELNEDYCKLQVKLHVPWNINFENDVNPQQLLWSEIYRSNSDFIPNFIDLQAIEPEEEEEGLENDQNDQDDNQDLEEWMIYQRQLPNIEQAQAELGLREQDTVFNWNASFSNYDHHQQIAQFIQLNLTQEIPVNPPPEMPNVQFSNDQNNVLNFIRRGINSVQSILNGNHNNNRMHILNQFCNQNQIVRSMIVQGKAGSGKSTVIKAAQSLCHRELGANSYITLAATGSAASLISGNTIHSKLMINVNNHMRTLSQRELNNLQQNLSECWFVIIDEFSLIGCSLFKKIDKRLREATGVENIPFGGLFLLILGDIKQLPPVKDRPFYGVGYNNLEDVQSGQDLYKSIESAVILPESFRQNVQQQEFRNILDRISNGEITHSDWLRLNSRRLDALDSRMFVDSIRLFDTNLKVHEFNETKLRTFQHVYRVKAINNCAEALRATSKTADNLENVIHLAIGARVMLRKNLATHFGLTNGSLRTIVDIVVGETHEMPLFVMVRFDR